MEALLHRGAMFSPHTGCLSKQGQRTEGEAWPYESRQEVSTGPMSVKDRQLSWTAPRLQVSCCWHVASIPSRDSRGAPGTPSKWMAFRSPQHASLMCFPAAGCANASNRGPRFRINQEQACVLAGRQRCYSGSVGKHRITRQRCPVYPWTNIRLN